MTDNEIIKALDFCEGFNGVSFCNDCPLFDKDKCVQILSHEAYNLINRQKAEIERLKCEMGKLLPKDCSYAMQMEVSNKLESQIKSEAIKEFAERLENNLCGCDVTGDRDNVGYITSDVHQIIDSLVKEMTE